MRAIQICFALLFIAAGQIHALEIPPKPTAWVTDNAGMLSQSAEQQLNEKIDSFSRSTGSQILVMTFPSLEGEVIEDYTIRVAEQWKVKGDRALILFVFESDRLVRLEVGYGLEGAIPDAYADRVVREVITPRFREGDFDGGITQAIDVLVARIRGEESPIAFDGPSREGPAAGGASGCVQLLIPLFILFFFLAVLGPLVRRTGMRGCGCIPIPFFFPGGHTFGGHRGGGFGGFGGGGGGIGGSWGGGGFGSFGGGGATGGW